LKCPIFGADASRCGRNHSSERIASNLAKVVVEKVGDAKSACAAMGCLMKCSRMLNCSDSTLAGQCRQVRGDTCGLLCGD